MEEIRDLHAKLDLTEERFRDKAFQSYRCFTLFHITHIAHALRDEVARAINGLKPDDSILASAIGKLS